MGFSQVYRITVANAYISSYKTAYIYIYSQSIIEMYCSAISELQYICAINFLAVDLNVINGTTIYYCLS